MEDGLREDTNTLKEISRLVLILVVMEDGLRGMITFAISD